MPNGIFIQWFVCLTAVGSARIVMFMCGAFIHVWCFLGCIFAIL